MNFFSLLKNYYLNLITIYIFRLKFEYSLIHYMHVVLIYIYSYFYLLVKSFVLYTNEKYILIINDFQN